MDGASLDSRGSRSSGLGVEENGASSPHGGNGQDRRISAISAVLAATLPSTVWPVWHRVRSPVNSQPRKCDVFLVSCAMRACLTILIRLTNQRCIPSVYWRPWQGKDHGYPVPFSEISR